MGGGYKPTKFQNLSEIVVLTPVEAKADPGEISHISIHGYMSLVLMVSWSEGSLG